MSIRRSGRSLCLLAYTFIAAPNTYTIQKDEAAKNFLQEISLLVLTLVREGTSLTI